MPAAAPSLRDNTVNIHHFKQLGKALRSVPGLGACGRECLVKGSAQFYQVVKKDLLRAVVDRDFISICWALSCRKISISSMLVPGLLFFFFISARVCNQVANVRALAAFIQIGAVYRVQHRAQALERVQAR